MSNGSHKPERLVNLAEAANRPIGDLPTVTVDIVEYFEKRLKTVEEKIERDKTTAIEVLGIFVALFTFIAVNVQLFSRIADLASAIWFMLLMSGVIIGILLVIEVVLNRRTWIALACLTGLATVQVVLGLYFTYARPIRLNPDNNQPGQVDNSRLDHWRAGRY